MLSCGLCQHRLDGEDADGSISYHGDETESGRAISKAVAAALPAHGEAAVDLSQYVLVNDRTSDWMMLYIKRDIVRCVEAKGWIS